MIHSKETNSAFYQELGKIFYSVAAADKVVRKEELAALRAIVKAEWLNIDETFDEFGTDSAYQMEIVFDWLDEKKLHATGALTSFEAFKNDHPSFFTVPVKDLILKTATAITSSFHGINKPELLMLRRLETVLTKD